MEPKNTRKVRPSQASTGIDPTGKACHSPEGNQDKRNRTGNDKLLGYILKGAVACPVVLGVQRTQHPGY